MWSLLGGHVEATDRDRASAAAREIREEAQLNEVTGKRLLFSHYEQKNGELYMFDVFVGHCYDERHPGSLLSEKIEESMWWEIETTNSLNLSKMARRAIDSLGENSDKSFVSECRHHFQMVLTKASLRGCDGVTLKDLKEGLEKCENLLYSIDQLPPPPSPNLVIMARKKVVVIVDDHQVMLETLCELFPSGEYKVYSFSDPKEAIDWLVASTVKIDAFITDYRMPHLNGVELVNMARPFLGSASIILMSAEDISAYEKKGVIFFQKPVLPEDLIRAIS